MKKVQKGFTLVELIVVITILAILATIAFISLQGYSQDAKNSKVGSDLRTLSSAIETRLTEGMTLTSVVSGGTIALNTADDGSTTFGTVSKGTSTGVTLDDTANSGNYSVGAINFVSLKQNGTDFLDPEENGYLVAYAADGDIAYYQVAGQTRTAAGGYEAVIKGNYIDEGGADDANGLITASGSTGGTGALVNGGSMTVTDNLY